MSRPEGSFFSFARSIQVLVFVWFAISGINLPLFINTDTETTTTTNGSMTIVYCSVLKHMAPLSRQIFWLTGRVLVFLLPMVITWISYIGIYWRMKRARSKVRWRSNVKGHYDTYLFVSSMWFYTIIAMNQNTINYRLLTFGVSRLLVKRRNNTATWRLFLSACLP